MAASGPMKPQSHKFSWNTVLTGVALVTLTIVAYFSWSAKQAAPNVTFTTITGEKISTQNLRGKVVVVNFWATSCETCVHEMPRMVETYNQYQSKGLELVAVAIPYDPPNYVLNFVQTRMLPFK